MKRGLLRFPAGRGSASRSMKTKFARPEKKGTTGKRRFGGMRTDLWLNGSFCSFCSGRGGIWMADVMKALVYEGPRTMNMRNVPVPHVAADEVLIKVEKAGICGSELSGYLGHNSLRKPPLVMGHEFAGTVSSVGSGVVNYQVGDRVTANPLVSCGVCRDCQAGHANLCHRRTLIG